jgi:hypothetical protein
MGPNNSTLTNKLTRILYIALWADASGGSGRRKKDALHLNLYYL